MKRYTRLIAVSVVLICALLITMPAFAGKPDTPPGRAKKATATVDPTATPMLTSTSVPTNTPVPTEKEKPEEPTITEPAEESDADRGQANKVAVVHVNGSGKVVTTTVSSNGNAVNVAVGKGWQVISDTTPFTPTISASNVVTHTNNGSHGQPYECTNEHASPASCNGPKIHGGSHKVLIIAETGAGEPLALNVGQQAAHNRIERDTASEWPHELDEYFVRFHPRHWCVDSGKENCGELIP